MIAKRDPYGVLVGKQEGKRALERPRSRWEDNTKLYLRKIGWSCIDWTHLAQNRGQRRVLVNRMMILGVP
jgi:hypothetical protein